MQLLSVSLEIFTLSVFHCCMGYITVIENFNETLMTARDEPAAFGKKLPPDGLAGYLMYANPPDACEVIEKPPVITGDPTWIALIMRNNCLFDVKVLNAQVSGYHAAIVYNSQSEDIFEMHGSTLESNITIPAVFVGHSDGIRLRRYCNRTDVHVRIDLQYGIKTFIYFILMGCVGLLGILVGVCIVFINWTCSRAKRRKALLSKRKLRQLPIHRFKTGDLYDSCAICLEEYIDGDKLRVLPCAHAYHCKCIDPWLTEKKNTCPLCKDVVGKPRNRSAAISNDETQQLLTEHDEEPADMQAATSSNAFSTAAEVHSSSQQRRTYGSLLVNPGPRDCLVFAQGDFFNHGLNVDQPNSSTTSVFAPAFTSYDLLASHNANE